VNRTAVAQDINSESFSPHSSGILQRKCTSCSNKTTAEGECLECANKKSKLQRKLSIGASNNPLEHEADRVADQVMSMSPNSEIASTTPKIQRSSASIGDIEVSVPSSVNRVLASSGTQMQPALRHDMEKRFSRDFSQVRLHTNEAATKSARELRAHAYTAGKNVVFDRGQFSPSTAQGRRLLAHELTHVVQQGIGLDQTSHAVIQRDENEEESIVSRQLNDILPGQVGLLTHISRVTQLEDIFGLQQLVEHIALIHANPAARTLVQGHGVPGIVALFDTRSGRQLNVSAAEESLTQHSARYGRDSLNSLNLRPRVEAPRTFLFNDPDTQHQENSASSAGRVRSTRNQVFIENALNEIDGGIFVRFSYPENEISPRGQTQRIITAKSQVLEAIANVVAEFTGLPPAANQAERNEQLSVRARLSEALRSLGRGSPLNIHIATEPTPQELIGGQFAAVTDRVFVNLQDVGNPARLQAAIRIPLTVLRGGNMPTTQGIENVLAISSRDLQDTMLHESLHVMLINQSSDANSIWASNQAQLTVNGSPSVVPKFIELIRKYLISQEELFAFDNVAELYPPVPAIRASYARFNSGVEQFLSARPNIIINQISRSIPVSERVARQEVNWTINYQMPTGTVNLEIDNIDFIDLLLALYPLG